MDAILQLLGAKAPEESIKTLSTAAVTAISEAAIGSPDMNELDIEESIKLIKALYRGTLFSSITTKRQNFVFVCGVRNIPLSQKPTRLEMYDKLSDSIMAEKQNLLGEEPVNRGPVLGKDVMQAIWADMRKTILPSWVGAAPKNWGTKKRGKLSADHLRTIFTIHLPTTLIWLWRDETGRKKDVLSNMIDLIVAIQAANYKSTNVDIAEIYDHRIFQYIDGAAKLFKEDNITPSQHSAFHIGGNLRDFGPQHSRGAQFYERYIHLLQRQNTNMKYGEMEATFMNATARAANLKAILADNPDVRACVSEAVKTYQHVSTRDSRGFRLAQMIDPDDTHFDSEAQSRWGALSMLERQLLQEYLSWRYGDFDLQSWTASGSIMDQISVEGVRYARKNVLKRDQDSNIIFNVPGTEDNAPGEILNIFRYWHTTPANTEIQGTYLVVNRFSQNPVLDRPDPYREQPPLFGYLATTTPLETSIIEARHIRSHFALTPITYNGQDLMYIAQQHLWLNTDEPDSEDESVNLEDDEDREEDVHGSGSEEEDMSWNLGDHALSGDES
ncbi:hypothetical protein C8R47DRAFT_1084487 [Mycena vitilis]|nr:hypothetical protein C8R47DRAFT_1084487 [Mycena vitilis]